MKRSRSLVIPHRRKREGKTDYRLRLRLLRSNKPRLVVRKSLNNIVCQIVKFEKGGDRVLVSASSRELKKLGWKFHGGNLPSAYLTGLLCAEKAKKHKIGGAVLDIGLYQSTPGNRLYSALKGAVDGGLRIPHSEGVFPKPERISGQHIAEYMEKLKAGKTSKYKKVFSYYLENKVDPKDLPKVFEHTKNRISGVKTKAEKGRPKVKSKKS